ncbi:hypothetical protein M413DRAFT_138114 [Hebeloma cylindrosporum]|uniref:Uncharacterized protein n=1 Tax=Hebeloma cylindrosporum TaxID=76867 RepID=A0A0C3BYX4_HEBCY|nr:hypothetical protein M413DRAFT_138114 [Hebeloma cylindrosporum h7]
MDVGHTTTYYRLLPLTATQKTRQKQGSSRTGCPYVFMYSKAPFSFSNRAISASNPERYPYISMCSALSWLPGRKVVYDDHAKAIWYFYKLIIIEPSFGAHCQCPHHPHPTGALASAASPDFFPSKKEKIIIID